MPSTRLGDFRQHLYISKENNNTEEYSSETAHIIAHIMCHFNNKTRKVIITKKIFYQLVQTHSLKIGIRKFGTREKKVTYKEMKQHHGRVVFTPVRVESLTKLERKRATESLIFLTEKKDGSVKSRTCTGSTL